MTIILTIQNSEANVKLVPKNNTGSFFFFNNTSENCAEAFEKAVILVECEVQNFVVARNLKH